MGTAELLREFAKQTVENGLPPAASAALMQSAAREIDKREQQEQEHRREMKRRRERQETISVELGTCSQCGKPSVIRTYTEQQAMYTLERDEQGWPEVESVRLSPGYDEHCYFCGHMDGEAPSY
jgi:hypothetical protein